MAYNTLNAGKSLANLAVVNNNINNGVGSGGFFSPLTTF